MRLSFLQILFATVMLLAAWGFGCELPLHDAPLRIDYYTIDTRQVGRVVVDAIYTNQSDRSIDALHLSFVAVSAHNKVVSSQTGLKVLFQGALAPEEQDAMRWYFNWALENNSEDMSTIAYVRGVRYSDGDVWQVQSFDIEQEIANFECPHAELTRFLVRY